MKPKKKRMKPRTLLIKFWQKLRKELKKVMGNTDTAETVVIQVLLDAINSTPAEERKESRKVRVTERKIQAR